MKLTQTSKGVRVEQKTAVYCQIRTECTTRNPKKTGCGLPIPPSEAGTNRRPTYDLPEGLLKSNAHPVGLDSRTRPHVSFHPQATSNTEEVSKSSDGHEQSPLSTRTPPAQIPSVFLPPLRTPAPKSPSTSPASGALRKCCVGCVLDLRLRRI